MRLALGLLHEIEGFLSTSNVHSPRMNRANALRLATMESLEPRTLFSTTSIPPPLFLIRAPIGHNGNRLVRAPAAPNLTVRYSDVGLGFTTKNIAPPASTFQTHAPRSAGLSQSPVYGADHSHDEALLDDYNYGIGAGGLFVPAGSNDYLYVDEGQGGTGASVTLGYVWNNPTLPVYWYVYSSDDSASSGFTESGSYGAISGNFYNYANPVIDFAPTYAYGTPEEYMIVGGQDTDLDGSVDNADPYAVIYVEVSPTPTLDTLTVADNTGAHSDDYVSATDGTAQNIYVATDADLTIEGDYSPGNASGSRVLWEVRDGAGALVDSNSFGNINPAEIATPPEGETYTVRAGVDLDYSGSLDAGTGEIVRTIYVHALGFSASTEGYTHSNATDGQNTAISTLSQSDQTASGAFIPINNDDDDYAHYDSTHNDLDPAAMPSTDDDFLKIHLAPVSGSGYYTVTLPVGVKAYTSQNHSSPITGTSGVPTHLTQDTDIFIEGTASGNGHLYLNWVSSGAPNVDHVDDLKVTVFDWSGALNVPGDAIYEYTATGSGTFSTVYGTINSSANGHDVMIKWADGPDVGAAVYTVNGNYQWGLEVNVVQITIAAPTGAGLLPFANGTPSQAADIVDGAGLHYEGGNAGTGTNSGITFAAHITLAGPNGKGVTKMHVGFIQSVTSFTNDAAYAGGNHLHSSLNTSAMPPTFAVPLVDTWDGTKPWYRDIGTANFNPTSNTNTQQDIISSDTPYDGPPQRYEDIVGGAGNHFLTSMTTSFAFRIDVCVQTSDTQNGAHDVYTVRATAIWSANLTGNVTNDASHTWSAVGGVTGITSPASGTSNTWTLVAGANSAVAADPHPFNDYLKGQNGLAQESFHV